jgi:hypothetical protein
MATESRFGRRIISDMLVSILKEPDTSTFWVSETPSKDNDDLRYVFVTYPEMPDNIELEKSEKYILQYLSQHILVARHLFPDRKTIIGIAIPNQDCKKINSNFIRILDGKNWTSEDDQMAEKLHKRNGVFACAINLDRVHFE